APSSKPRRRVGRCPTVKAAIRYLLLRSNDCNARQRGLECAAGETETAAPQAYCWFRLISLPRRSVAPRSISHVKNRGKTMITNRILPIAAGVAVALAAPTTAPASSTTHTVPNTILESGNTGQTLAT